MKTRLRILHTADIHLGLTFGDYPEEVAQTLTEARFEVLERMVAQASSERCDLLVIGGDLFDTTRVPKKTVVRAARILSGFDGQVLVLPGNHDYITVERGPAGAVPREHGVERGPAGAVPREHGVERGPAGAVPREHGVERLHDSGDLWTSFSEAKGERVRVLGQAVPVLFPELGVCVYPAPCQSRHSKEHAVAWIARAERAVEARFHIGIAHGSFEGLTPDLEGDYFPMRREDLVGCGLDLWLMGHIHLQYPPREQAGERIFYPGTPEPDGFDCRHEGKAWLIELGDDQRIEARSLATGQFRFGHLEERIQSLSDLDRLKDRLGDGKNRLLKLKITGTLPREELLQIGESLQGIRENHFRLIEDLSGLQARISAREIEGEFPAESFAGRLLRELLARPEDSEALNVAYGMIRDLQEGVAGE